LSAKGCCLLTITRYTLKILDTALRTNGLLLEAFNDLQQVVLRHDPHELLIRDDR
jgi:hypothetical protein